MPARVAVVLALALNLVATAAVAAGLSETGTDDIRLTNVGVDGDVAVSPDYTALVHNGDTNQYLLVWQQSDALDIYEVYAQLLQPDLAPVGVPQRVSFMGGNDADTQWGVYDGFVQSPNQNDAGHRLENVAVAYDSTHQKYLAVWSGDDDQAGLADGEYEIFGQLLNADGTRFGVPVRLSTTGTDGDANTDAYSPAVAYDATSDRFFVVWEADGANDGRYQIDGVMLSADASGIVERERFSNLSGLDNGGDATDTRYSAYAPALAPASGAFLVAWDGFDAVRGGATNRNIFWRTVTTTDTGNLQYLENSVKDAWPAVAFAATDGEFIVQFQHETLGAWLSSAVRIGIDGSLQSSEPELLEGLASGNEPHAVVMADAIRNMLVARVNRNAQNATQIDANLISDALTGETALQRISASTFPPQQVAAAYNSSNGEFAVVWRGDLASGEAEIFGQRLTVAGITDLAITAFDVPPNAINAGDSASVALTIENLGPGDADNVSLAYAHNGSDLTIASAKARSITDGTAAFDCDTANAVCALGTVVVGEQYRVDIVFDTAGVAQSATYTLDATLSSDGVDSDGSDNIASKTFSVNKEGGGNPPPPAGGSDGGGGSAGVGLLALLWVLRRLRVTRA